MSINSFLSTIAKNGGMSYSNNFAVKVINPPVPIPGGEEVLSLFCDEAQLPNVNTAQGQINGLYLGSGSVNYPHTRVFTEIQLSFMLDANLSVLKFLNAWVDKIFMDAPIEKNNLSLSAMSSVPSKPVNRAVRLNYKDQYARTILISKTEVGPYAPNQRVPITYVLEQAYPFAIDAVPLQYGSSQVTRVSAQFSYARHYTIANDIKSVVGTIEGMYNSTQKKAVQQRVVPGNRN